MENNERPESMLPADSNRQIQLVVNHPAEEEDTIDLGRVFHNMKVKSRIFAWVLVLCLLVGLCAPLLMYQFQKTPLTVTSVVTLRYDVPSGKAGFLVTPDGAPLDLGTVTSAPVLQKALDGLALSKPVTIENLRNSMTVTRVLTDESSRTKEVLAGLAEAKNVEAYTRLEDTELQYQNRFIVSLTNSFGDEDEDSRVKYELKDEEVRVLLNRILDAYNDTLVRQYANVRLPEDKVSLIDTEELDLPEIVDSLRDALDSLLTYCNRQPNSVKAYRSWQTGLSLQEWTAQIRTIQSVSIDYLEAYIYSRGVMKDKDAVALTYRYRIRTLQSELDKINENIVNTDTLLKNYKNNDVVVSMQESDGTRTTKMTTAYYNQLVLRRQNYNEQAAALRTEIAETQNKLDRLSSTTRRSEVREAEQELNGAVAAVKSLQGGIRAHMTELFESSLFTTYSEHSAPQGEAVSFLKASSKNMIIFGVVGLVAGCGLWFLAALAPEFQHKKEEPVKKADEKGKEAEA
ncbi:MAG: hypothetical protein IKG87_03710 [Clostridia bacterium]|nr:hypothetical protein [Clostridia bacterium]